MEDQQEKITLILDWHTENKHLNFDPSFVTDLQEKLDEFGKLTPAQEKALDRIIQRWEIE